MVKLWSKMVSGLLIVFSWSWLVGGVEHFWEFQEFHHPKWRTHIFKSGSSTNQRYDGDMMGRWWEIFMKIMGKWMGIFWRLVLVVMVKFYVMNIYGAEVRLQLWLLYGDRWFFHGEYHGDRMDELDLLKGELVDILSQLEHILIQTINNQLRL